MWSQTLVERKNTEYFFFLELVSGSGAASLSFLRSKNEREAVPLFFFMVLGGAENQFVLGSGAAENDKKK